MFGKEILLLWAPITASLCENSPDDFIYDDFLQIKYKYINRLDSWINHERHCQELDPRAHLPSIYGKRKNRFVFSMAETHVAIGMAFLNDDDLSEEYWINKDDPDEYGYRDWKAGDVGEGRCTYIKKQPRRILPKGHVGDWHAFDCNAEIMHGFCEIQCSERTKINGRINSDIKRQILHYESDEKSEESDEKSMDPKIHPIELPAVNYGNLLLTYFFESYNDQELYHKVTNSYGCWCPALNTQFHNVPFKGRPLDDIDSACREWMTCRHCNVKINNTDCTGNEGYTILMHEDNGVVGCGKQDICSKSRCECDLHLAERVTELLNTFGDLPSDNLDVGQESCIKSNPYGPKKDECCGKAPFYEKYSSETHCCENDKVVLIHPGPEPTLPPLY